MHKWIVKNSPLLISTILVVALLAMASRGAIQSQVGLAIAGPGSSWINLQDASVGTPISTGLAAVGPYGYNGTSFDSLRTATVGNNVAATGLGVAAVYGQYNASLPTLTTALYSALQTDINGRLMFGTSTATIGSVTAIGSKTPADTYTNPTDAFDSLSFNMVWNGSTWDRLYGDKTNGAFAQVKATVLATGASTIFNGQVGMAVTAAPIGTNPSKQFCVEALAGNPNKVYLGGASVTTSGSTGGLELTPGSSRCYTLNNTNLVYAISTATGNTVSFDGIN
jgi:hypothetical protein